MNHFSRHFGLECPVLIYCEDFVNKVLGAVVAGSISANWNEFIRPKTSIEDSLPCHEKFLQDVFIPAAVWCEAAVVPNVVLKFSVDVSQDKGKLRQAGVSENILINHADSQHTLSPSLSLSLSPGWDVLFDIYW